MDIWRPGRSLEDHLNSLNFDSKKISVITAQDHLNLGMNLWVGPHGLELMTVLFTFQSTTTHVRGPRVPMAKCVRGYQETHINASVQERPMDRIVNAYIQGVLKTVSESHRCTCHLYISCKFFIYLYSSVVEPMW